MYINSGAATTIVRLFNQIHAEQSRRIPRIRWRTQRAGHLKLRQRTIPAGDLSGWVWSGCPRLFGTTTARPRHIHTHTLTQYATTPCKPVCELTRGQNGGYLVTNTSRTGLGFPPPSVAKQGLKEAWGVRSTHRITRRLAFVFNLLRINTYEIWI